MPIDRRDFLRASAAAAIAGALPSASRPADAAAREFTAKTDVELVARPDELQLLPGEPTGVWRYAARVLRGPAHAVQTDPAGLGHPVIRARKGDRIRVRYRNLLPQRSNVHWHGLAVPERMDGHPRDLVSPGGDFVYEFEILNRAGSYWFHPHPHGLTGMQVYGGLAGMLLVSDDEEDSLRLPTGERDIPIVLADRTFDAANRLIYETAMGPGMMGAMAGFVGERILANNRPALAFPEGNGPFRLRLLNGSNSRIVRIARSDRKPLVAIASDGGLLPVPEVRPALVLGPAERVELWLDLREESEGARVALTAEPLDIGGAGMMGGMGMRGMMGGGFRPGARAPWRAPHPFAVFVARRGAAGSPLPDRLSEIAPAAAPASKRARVFALTLGHMRWGINGRTFVMDEVAPDERVAFGETEVWEFVNRTPMMAVPHPMHVHLAQFRVLERLGTPPAFDALRAGLLDGGYKDTVLVLPGERVRVLLRFDTYRGRYLYHCHNLVHEDMGMMRNFSVA